MKEKLFIVLAIVLFATVATAGSSLVTIRDQGKCEAAGGKWSPTNPLFPCGPKDGAPTPTPTPTPTPIAAPITYTTPALCHGAGFVWDESTAAVFGRAMCRNAKAGETPPGTMAADGTYAKLAIAPNPTPATPTGQTSAQSLKELFLEWSAASHWAKRREMIKDELSLIESLLPPGEVAMMVFLKIGDKGFYAKLDLFGKLVLVEAQVPFTVPPEFDALLYAIDRREAVARILYFMSAE